jgi:hypothetical protein
MTATTPTPNGHAPPALGERLSADDYAYFARCQEGVRQAQAVLQSWGAFLCERYQVGPTDRINADGTIERGILAAEPVP